MTPMISMSMTPGTPSSRPRVIPVGVVYQTESILATLGLYPTEDIPRGMIVGVSLSCEAGIHIGALSGTWEWTLGGLEVGLRWGDGV